MEKEAVSEKEKLKGWGIFGFDSQGTPKGLGDETVLSRGGFIEVHRVLDDAGVYRIAGEKGIVALSHC